MDSRMISVTPLLLLLDINDIGSRIAFLHGILRNEEYCKI